jgi:hypothetical protein
MSRDVGAPDILEADAFMGDGSWATLCYHFTYRTDRHDREQKFGCAMVTRERFVTGAERGTRDREVNG